MAGAAGTAMLPLSGGASLQTNIRLFHHNVSLACAVAAACARPHEGD
jgi:pseudouridine-5'-phosphate glycosidase